MRITFYLLAFIFSLFTSSQVKSFKKFQFSGFAQGTTYHITYYASDSIVTQKQIDSILDKIDSSLSLYKSYSLVNRFNHSSKGVIADEHMKIVVLKALDTYHKTNGIFDITVYPLTQAWGFGVKKIDSTPSIATIRSLLPCIGSDKLYWTKKKLMKKKACVELDPNGIAQGYSVDVIAGFIEKHGVKNYIAELGGELRVKGRKQPGNEKMKIGIEVPGEEEFEISMRQKIVSIDSGALTTSGSYRKFYESNGKKISHIMDPRTGLSSQNELISVTVFANDAITADAYDNALMVMGLKKALAFVEKRKDLAAHFIYHRKDGTIADTASTRFYKFLRN